MKIFEQIDWGQAESDQKTIDQGKQLIVKKQLTPTNTTPKKDDTKKDSEPKKDKGKSIERSEKLTPQATYQWKLISNSIKFIEAISSVKYNRLDGFDEEAVYRIIKKYLIPNVKDKNSAAYTDMIIRLLYGNLRYLTKKYPKQVKYFITRNGSTGTTIEYLQGIQPYYLDYQSLTGLLYRNGKRLGLDDSTDEAKGVRRLLSQLYNPKFAFIDGVTPKLNLAYSAKQAYDRIAFAYENTIWGVPGGKRKNLPER
jgi:hypothetical protein